MASNVPQPKRRDNVLSTLNVAIETLNLAKELCSFTPAKPVFGSVSVVITMIRVGFLLVYVTSVSRFQANGKHTGLNDQPG